MLPATAAAAPHAAQVDSASATQPADTNEAAAITPETDAAADVTVADASPSSSASASPSPSSPSSSPLPPAVDSSYTPVLSKSAKRRHRAKLAEACRAEAAFAQSGLARAPPPSSAFRSPPHSSIAPAHMHVYHTPGSAGANVSMHRGGGSGSGNASRYASTLRSLSDLFPSVDSDVLQSVFESCGHSYEQTMEYLLAQNEAGEREEREVQRALNESMAAAAIGRGEAASVTSSPFAPRSASHTNHLSALSSDLFSIVCDFLNHFELARLSATCRDAHSQIEHGAFTRVDKLDFARYASWPDWRLLRMIARFPHVTSLSFRNTNFKSFKQIAPTCFGRHIRSMVFSGCLHLQDIHLSELFDLGEHLTSLDLSQTEITDEALAFIATARYNAQLAKLNVSDCKYISSEGVRRVLEGCVGLEWIDLRGTNVTKSILNCCIPSATAGTSSSASSSSSSASTSAPPQPQHHLLHLNLSRCRKLSERFKISIPSFSFLQWLSLNGNPSIKSVSLALPALHHLNLSNSPHVQSLQLYTPQLKTLQLNGCLLLQQITPLGSGGSPQPPTGLQIHSTLQPDRIPTQLEDMNFNLCRSVTSQSFQNILSGAVMTLKQLSCRGCLLLSDTNLALLTREHTMATANSAAPTSTASAAASAAAPAVSSFLSPLEFIDLSGCKMVSAQALQVITRMVAESNERRAAAHSRMQAANTLPLHWSTASRITRNVHPFSSSCSSEEEQGIGGLDDDE